MGFKPRDCFIKKCVDFKGFGFTLHAEVENGKCKGFINKIDEGSPAEYSGLLVGDRLVEVNGVNIENDTYQHIIEKIIASGDTVRLLVVDSETDDYYTGLGMTVTASMSGDQQSESEPNIPAPDYTDAIRQPYNEVTQQSYINVLGQRYTEVTQNSTQQAVGPNYGQHPPRHTQAPISNTISDTARLISASSPAYGNYEAHYTVASVDRVLPLSDTEDYVQCCQYIRLIRLVIAIVFLIIVVIIICVVNS